MARTCMRPGCDRPAAARLAFDPVALQLWLDPLGQRSAPVQELCEFHIERLTIPRGWSATDRRPGPQVSGIEVVSPPPPERVIAEPVVEVAPEPEPVVAVEPEPVIEVAPEPEHEPVIEVAPEPEPEPVEPEPVVAVQAEPAPRARKRPSRPSRPAAKADTPLLSRAFAWTGPQQSILTQGPVDEDAALDADTATDSG